MNIIIRSAQQRLFLYKKNKLIITYSISTAKNGLGEKSGSFQTPRGQHEISEKIGEGVPMNTVFVSRKPTGEIYSPKLAEQYPDRDWILTRILCLNGLEEGKNRGGDVDTRMRYIYIHGAPDYCIMGQPLSHGCIRMRNQDMIELYDEVVVGTPVLIVGENE